MKKILLTIAAVLTVLAAGAQDEIKSVPAATKALSAAREATQNPKKNTKVATWIKYGQALVDAYNAPAGIGIVGIPKDKLAEYGETEKPSSEESVTIGGARYDKMVFATKNYYFDESGKLAIIEVTKPIEKDALTEALDAFSQAAKLDNGSKTKDLVAAIKDITAKFSSDAVSAYSLGDYAKSSICFENAAKASVTAPCTVLDTNAVYNSGLTAYMGGNTERAKSMFEKCLGYGYAGTDGEVYVRLADIASKAGDADGSKNYLEEGFSKFPQSQGIIVGLINYYMTTGGNTDRFFELLDIAKANDPKNASLYYAEGDIHQKLGEYEKAEIAFDKCAEIDPAYEYGYIGKGVMLYNRAIEFQELASNEMDDAKYQEYADQFEKSLKACIEPFEKAYEISKNEETRKTVAEFLKNACFRFRTESEDFQQKYDKYAAIVG